MRSTPLPSVGLFVCGLLFRCHRLSMSRPSRSPRSVCKPIKRNRRAVLSCPVWLEATRHADPTKRREAALLHDLSRLQKSIERLLTAYQEDLLSLDELRHRMPDLRRREHAIRAELQSIADQTTDRTAYLRLPKR